jgi:hypothetical protein
MDVDHMVRVADSLRLGGVGVGVVLWGVRLTPGTCGATYGECWVMPAQAWHRIRRRAMKKRTVPVLTAMLAVAVTSVGLAGTAAQADPVETIETHCAYDVDTRAMSCAASAEQARAGIGTRASYAVARVWKGYDYTGSSLTYYKSSGCTPEMTDLEYRVDVVPSGWNDVLSSVKTDLTTSSTRCSLRIFEDGRLDPPSFTIDHYTPNLGAFGWNNRASSWYIS